MIGSTISHYRILDKLGEGGMGTVYRAEDTRLGRQVALKMLPPETAGDPVQLERFQREAKAVAALNHPSIVTIHSVEASDAGHFITMELVEGERLADAIPPGGMPLERLIAVAVPLADALHTAHQRGITHRDLKPANVMVSRDGRVKILDFGLAKLLPSGGEAPQAETLTIAGTVVGTVPYMSPEQCQSRELDHRTDIFSLGVVLHEMAVGERPFRGDSSADVISAILRDDPPSVSEARRELPTHLGRMIARCLEKDPSRRYQTALDVRNELDQIRKERESSASSAHQRVMPSIAVLPFADLSPEKDQDYFCEGLAEELINALVKVEGLRVASRASAFQIKETVADVREIGRRLKVDSVLGGSVRKAGKRLRITAQLTNVIDGYHIWSERYDRQLEDVFAIQDEIAQAIAQALKVTLGPSAQREIEEGAKVDVQAYDYYLKGRKFFYQFRQQGFEFARQMFARAIVIDPKYARAYAGVADCCSFLYMYFDSSDENLKEADAASRKAVEIDPGSAEAHASRGLAVSLSQRFDEARVEFETALRLDPKNYEAHYLYGRALASQGKQAEAENMFRRAAQINPDEYNAPLFMAQAILAQGRKEEGREAYRQAIGVVEKHLDLNPDDARALVLGAGVLSNLGDKEKALKWAGKASVIDPDNPSIHYNLACVYAVLGELERGLDSLEQSITTGMAQKEWVDNDPDLDPLREHPRFTELLARMEHEE